MQSFEKLGWNSHLEVFSPPRQASEQEAHRSELQKMLEQWEKEKAETEVEHEEKLFDMKQKVANMQAQQEEERIRIENAKQEVKTERRICVVFCKARAVGNCWIWGCVEPCMYSVVDSVR